MSNGSGGCCPPARPLTSTVSFDQAHEEQCRPVPSAVSAIWEGGWQRPLTSRLIHPPTRNRRSLEEHSFRATRICRFR